MSLTTVPTVGVRQLYENELWHERRSRTRQILLPQASTISIFEYPDLGSLLVKKNAAHALQYRQHLSGGRLRWLYLLTTRGMPREAVL